MSEFRCSRVALPDLLGVDKFAESRIEDLELLDAAVAAATARGLEGETEAATVVSTTTTTEQERNQDDQDDASFCGKPPKDQSRGLRDQTPVLARHMRRRTTSHKPRRMSSALKNAKREARAGAGANDPLSQCGDKGDELPFARNKDGGDDKARCRKHRRRPRAMLAARSPHSGGLLEEGSPARWLETHIWHAKRMHMKEMWGFKIPFKSNRGHRAAVQAALESCTVQDVTFLRPLELRGPKGCLLGVLGTMTDPMDDRFSRPDCINGFVEASTHLYRVNGFPLGSIAPVTIIWSPAGDATTSGPDKVTMTEEKNKMDYDGDGVECRRAWLWVHPAAAKEVLLEIRKACVLEGAGAVEVGTVGGGLCRLRVRGSKAHDTVCQVLRPRARADGDNKRPDAAAAAAAAAPAERQAVGLPPTPPSESIEIGDAAHDNAALWGALECSCCVPAVSRGNQGVNGGGSGVERRCTNNPRSRLPSGSVLAISVLDPRERVPMRGKFCVPEEILPVAEAPSAVASPNTVKAAVASTTWPPRRAALSPLWGPEARRVSSLLADARPDHLLNEARHQKRLQHSWEHMTLSTVGHEGDAPHFPDGGRGCGEGFKVTPILLVSSSTKSVMSSNKLEGFPRERGGNKKGKKYQQRGTRFDVEAGWDLILPAGWAGVFFQALVMAGARAISVEDADSLAFEAGTPSFPADFPDTTAGRRHWDDIGRESMSAWARTRPKHRGFKAKDRFPVPTSLPIQAQTRTTTQDQKQHRQESDAASSRLRPCHFRPDFCSLAMGLSSDVTPDAQIEVEVGGADDVEVEVASVERETGASAGISTGTADSIPKEDGKDEEVAHKDGKDEEVVHKHGKDGDGPPAVAVASSVDGRQREFFAVARGFSYVQAFLPGDGIREDADDEQMLPRKGLLPPIQLAFPTMLEVLLRQHKGVPKSGALIHPASPQHHTLWLEGEQAGVPWPGFGASNQKASVHGDSERAPPAIGAVTSGGFSILRGGAIGRGYCEARAVRSAIFGSLGHHRHLSHDVSGEMMTADWLRPPQGWALVLVGNDAGSWFRPAIIEVVV